MDELYEAVEEFINDRKMFTSVDVANAVKRGGTWIRNREVADYLRRNVITLSQGMYETTVIDVESDGAMVQANLYHPMGTDPDLYTMVAQKAMTRDEFDALHAPKPDPVVEGLKQAIKDRVAVKFKYQSEKDTRPIVRLVDPWLVAVSNKDVMYLVGYQHFGGSDASIRQYRVEDIQDLEVTPTAVSELPTKDPKPTSWKLVEAYIPAAVPGGSVIPADDGAKTYVVLRKLNVADPSKALVVDPDSGDVSVVNDPADDEVVKPVKPVKSLSERIKSLQLDNLKWPKKTG